MIVVIPSARSVDLQQLAPLIDSGARFLVVDDSPGRIRIDHPRFEVYAWPDRERLLGDLEHAIPRRTGACRDLGFLIAWREASDDEVIVALDDDCQVLDPEFAARAEAALARAPRPVACGAGRHWNVLDLYANVPDGLFPRGFPYAARATYRPFRFDGEADVAPLFHLGLWRGVFDVNAIDKLEGPACVHEQAELRHDSVVVPSGKLVSACSMNMMFRRAVIPALYQLPMHVTVMPNWVVDRYGDIWGGFILKALMDRRGDAMSVGAPMIRHVKDGDLRRNVWQEHVGHLVNDELLLLLERSAPALEGGGYLDLVEQLIDRFAAACEQCSPLLRAYVSELLPRWRAWARALRRRSA